MTSSSLKLEIHDYQALDSLWLNNMEKYKCSICMCVVFAPINQPCAHLHCLACITNHLKNKTDCPVCRQSLDCFIIGNASINSYVQHEIFQQSAKCPFSENGCTWTGELGVDHRNYQAHAKICTYDFVKCSLCDQNVILSHMDDHCLNVCTRRQCHLCKCNMDVEEFKLHYRSFVQSEDNKDNVHPPCDGFLLCPHGCTQMVLKSKLEAHNNLCKERIITCTFCALPFKFIKLYNHYENDCLKRIVECTHCKERMTFLQLQEDHLYNGFDSNDVIPPCPNLEICKSGCGLFHRKDELDKHQLTCSRVSQLCTYRCGLYHPINDTTHYQSICLNRPIPCFCCNPPVIIRFCDHVKHIKLEMHRNPDKMSQLLMDLKSNNSQDSIEEIKQMKRKNEETKYDEEDKKKNKTK
jgi:hypothetical protein